MKNTIIISATALILVIVFSCFPNLYAQVSRDELTVETEKGTVVTPRKSATPAPRMNAVRMTDFYLRDGKLVFGKLVSEDKNKVTVEQLEGSRIVVSTYSRREVDSRTLHIKTVPEVKYYLDLAEYFAARTGDFKDDTDDFIQAIRRYEKAKRIFADTQDPNSEKIREIEDKIKELQADRQVWEREVESRARLKKLEFEATIETRIKELEDKVNANSQQMEKILADVRDNYQRLEMGTAGIDQAISRRLDILEERIEANRALIDPWARYPRYPYQYRRY